MLKLIILMVNFARNTFLIKTMLNMIEVARKKSVPYLEFHRTSLRGKKIKSKKKI